ncbi:MAG: VCBS repeat-containing protein, partial [Hymenobacteraceae bacterium]|nr:VCBS repeat-containing protein [Hymenobacteraceae bacterium]
MFHFGRSLPILLVRHSWALALFLLAPFAALAQAPTITGFSPGTGPVGTVVTVTGTNLTSTTSVRFGELPAVFSVTSATQLTVTVPRFASNQKFRVTTPAGSALSVTAFSVTHSSASNLYPQVTTAFPLLSAGFYSTPAIADLDGDGKLDLLIGNNDGIIFHYEQNAINSQAFTQVSDLSFNDIAVGFNSKPTITDIDGDGLLDLLIGEYDGNINRYEQSAVNSLVFNLITTAFAGINVGIDSAPTVTDLDGDGLLDLIVGEDDGNLNRYEQTAANLATFTVVAGSFTGIDVGFSSAPTFTDFDADGLLDLLIGADDGNLYHYEQTAVNGTTFTLVTATFYNINVGNRSAPIVTDIDGDGLIDLVVGQFNGGLLRYEQADPPTALALSNNTLPENVPANTVVGTFSTTDLTPADVFTYTLVAGTGSTDNLSFTTTNVGGVGSLRIKASPNFEVKSSYSVRVRTTDATGLFFEQSFIVTITDVPPPVITNISPTQGGVGSSVTITGTSLYGTTPVTFTGTTTNTVTVGYTVNAAGTQITGIIVPTGAQTGTIRVTTPEGTVTSTQTFTVCRPVAITKNITVQLSPSGTASITAAMVNNNSTANCGFAAGGGLSVSPSTFTCANLGANTVTLTVTDASGATKTAPATVTITASPTATLTSLNPNPATPGATVTAAGTNLSGATALTVNGASATINSLTASGFTFVVPGGATASGNVVLTLPCNQNLSLPFSVTQSAQPPTITSFTPISGPVGTSVTMTGTNLGGTSLITFTGASGNTVTTGYTVNAAGTQITGIIVPNGAQTGTISVMTAAGSVTSTQTFTVCRPVAIAKNITVQLSANGTASITASAVNNGSTANCGFAAGGGLSVSPSTFTCANLGNNAVTLTVTDGAGATSTAPATVNVTTPPAATLTSLSPSSGSVGQTITASGTNLSGATGLTVNGAAATISNLTATSFTFVVPSGASSTGNVVVTLPCSQTQSIAFSVCRPQAIAQNASVELGADGTATVTPAAVNNGSTANCGFAAGGGLSVSPSTFTCANLGNNAVTLTVTDAAGNTSTAPATVTVTIPTTVATTTWNGTVSTDWTDCRNWGFGKVPDATTSAVIPVV